MNTIRWPTGHSTTSDDGLRWTAVHLHEPPSSQTVCGVNLPKKLIAPAEIGIMQYDVGCKKCQKIARINEGPRLSNELLAHWANSLNDLTRRLCAAFGQECDVELSLASRVYKGLDGQAITRQVVVLRLSVHEGETVRVANQYGDVGKIKELKIDWIEHAFAMALKSLTDDNNATRPGPDL